MSARSDVADKIWELVNHLNLNTSPVSDYGVGPGNRYRHINCGRARYLDLEIRVYSPTFIYYHDSRRNKEKFTSYAELEDYLRHEVCLHPRESA